MRRIRIGTRGSRLALVQAELVRSALARRLHGVEIEIEIVQTTGDRVLDRPLSQIGSSGLFIKEIESALVERRIDLAVHSMKDLESTIAPGLAIAATTERVDPRDALVSRSAESIESLPRGGRVATGSLRRRSQLLAVRPDLKVEDLRGNVPTRLEKFDRSSWDAVVLASAGLERLDLSRRVRAHIPIATMTPAVGQGALAIEIREEDEELKRDVLFLNHRRTELAVASERSFLARLAGGCRVPIGAYAEVDEAGALSLSGYVGSVDGARHLRLRIEGRAEEGGALGGELAESMLRDGAREIIAEVAKIS